jgi:alpha-ketoglutarate-dependent taurine dioxygenase
MQGISGASRGAKPEVDSLAWKRPLLTSRRWLIPVPDTCAAEFEQIARVAREHFGPLADLDPGQFDLPACAEVMAQLRAKLLEGPGFAVLDRVPVEQYRCQEGQAIGWILANLMGRVVAQKRDGTRLYDVRDTGKAIAHGVRRSITNLEQEFHTDGGWLRLPPSFIGLYCLQPAAEGGMSRCASLVTVREALRGHPDLLDRLHQPFWWDRQAEHAPDDVTYSRAPIYWHAAGRALARYYDDYVRKGYALAGEPLDRLGVDALEAMREAIEAEDNWIEFLLEPGQFLYVNNRQIAHSRTAFRDDDAKRHLMRFWNRDEGSPDLEGGRAAPATH